MLKKIFQKKVIGAVLFALGILLLVISKIVMVPDEGFLRYQFGPNPYDIDRARRDMLAGQSLVEILGYGTGALGLVLMLVGFLKGKPSKQ